MKKLFSIVFTFIFLFGFAGCKSSDVHVETNTLFSPDDYPSRVGLADYLFVAHVIEITNTFEVDGRLQTTYKAKVLKNIKGELIQDDYVYITRHGGVYKDGRKYIIDGVDLEPEVDRVYTILAYTILDFDYGKSNGTGFKIGSLYSSGMELTFVDINAEKDTAKQIDEKLEKNETYIKWKKGYDNEVPYERERAKSIYDVNYKE